MSKRSRSSRVIERYDELPWVEQMLARHETPVDSMYASCPKTFPTCQSVQVHQDEPFGGMPTLAYAKLFESGRVQKA